MANESKSLVSEEQVAKPAVRVGPPRGILTVDASAAQVQKQEDLVWHELTNAQRTRKYYAEISAELSAWTEDG